MAVCILVRVLFGLKTNDLEAERPGGRTTRRQNDLEAERPGGRTTRRQNDLEAEQVKVNSLTHMVVVVDENSGESATAALEEQLQVSASSVVFRVLTSTRL